MKSLLLRVFFFIAISANLSFAQVLMNEIYSRGVPANPDWIEIYNGTSAAIDITGYKIYDGGGNAGTKPKKLFPAGSVIPAMGFLVIVVDDADASGFGLGSGGDEVWLEDGAGLVIDHTLVPAMPDTATSFSRVPNGTANWVITSNITRGVSNNLYLMNEIFSRGVPADPDWIEIYNASNSPIDITGYKIYDGGGNGGTKPKKLFPAGSVIPANGFLIIVVDDADASGFGLGSGGDEVWLEDAAGNVIDHTLVPAMPVATTSFSRVPDGSDNWVITNTITKGTANIFTTDVADEISNPVSFSLSQNFPNPFNPATTISYEIAQEGFVSLRIYDVLGNEVSSLVNRDQKAGRYQVTFEGKNLSSGIYVCRLQAGEFVSMIKMNLLK